jgi:hypothetical protein
MDLALYLRVLWRFRFLVVLGLLAAISLAALSFVRVSFDDRRPQLHYRDAEVWESRATLLVTERGFPWGRVTPESEVLPASPTRQAPAPYPQGVVPRFANWDRFRRLAALYARFGESDPVQSLMREKGPLPGVVRTRAVTEILEAEGNANDLVDPLPVLEVTGVATSPAGAMEVARRGSEALREFVRRMQEASRTPARDRVLLQPLEQPRTARLVAGRSKTTPVLVFTTIMIVVFGLAFVLENLRPRVRPVAGEPAVVSESSRRLA